MYAVIRTDMTKVSGAVCDRVKAPYVWRPQSARQYLFINHIYGVTTCFGCLVNNLQANTNVLVVCCVQYIRTEPGIARPVLCFDCSSVSATCMGVPHVYSEDEVSTFHRNVGTAYTVTSQKTVCYGHLFSPRYWAGEPAGVSQLLWTLGFGLEDLVFESAEGEDILFPKGPDRLWSPNSIVAVLFPQL
jgi:hypothetical protein